MCIYSSSFIRYWCMIIIAGMDEVGRGSLAGPLVVGCVITDTSDAEWDRAIGPTTKDSKQHSVAQRVELWHIINKVSPWVGVAWATNLEVDELGLTAALRLAARRILDKLKRSVDLLIMDGRDPVIYAERRVKSSVAIVRGDYRIRVVGCASIVAKVFRDQWMQIHSMQYPKYGWASNVGYGTAEHIASIKSYGATVLHRRSFIGKYV